MKVMDCARCGHAGDEHKLDDSLNLDPTAPDTPFRCIAGAIVVEGRLIRACYCPDFIGRGDL